jgi:mitofilin
VKKPSIQDSRPAVLPGGADTNQKAPGPVATSINAADPTPKSQTTISPQDVPLTPPPPPNKIQTSPPTSIPPPPSGSYSPPSPPPKKPRRIIRKLFTTLILLSIAGFGGGVYYSRVNDNFHDFFTEYVPFGEEAVLWLEERDFRKRFPSIGLQSPAKDTGSRVKIPSQSGVTPKITKEEKVAAPKSTESLRNPEETTHGEKVSVVEAVKVKNEDATASKPAPAGTAPEPAAHAKTEETVPIAVKKSPEVNEPSVAPKRLDRVDPLNINGASEPLVQDLVKILNDIITVVNADNSGGKFTSTIGKAKSELTKVSGRIQDLKNKALKEADEKVRSSHEDFDRAAKELIRRLEGEMAEQETKWKEDYENERQRLQQNYELRLAAELSRAKEVNDQRLRNELLEQAVEMQRRFVSEVKERVEEERNARLGKLSDLSNTVNDLEKLTTDWNSVVDSNLKTQHLHVAVEAVRASLENQAKPRPFVRELAALKEIASDDPVVDAAINSISPVAYQRGVPNTGQLIDRFRRVAGEVRKASLLPEEAGVASHASSYLLSKLLFKKKGVAEGDDVESILTRAETYLEEGNLDEAAREMNGLKGWAKTLSRDWLGEVRRVLEVKQALDVSIFKLSPSFHIAFGMVY